MAQWSTPHVHSRAASRAAPGVRRSRTLQLLLVIAISAAVAGIGAVWGQAGSPEPAAVGSQPGPAAGDAAMAVAEASAERLPAAFATYQVQPGDTLSTIAERRAMTAVELSRWNPQLAGAEPAVGQWIWVPLWPTPAADEGDDG